MARKPAPTKAHEPEASPADQAFGAARAFVEHLATLAYHARHFQPRPDKPDAWQDPAMTYAMAFVAWFDLSHLLTPAVRTEARRVYPPGSPAIKLGKAKPTPTVIEAVADELGVYFRDTVYAGRRHPLEPDRERGESALSLLRCGSIDFDDLRTQLIREAEAVIAAASKPNAPTIDPAILARLEAGIAAVHSIGSNFDAGMARVGRVIESLGARDDDAGIGGTDTDWKDVQGRLLAKRDRGEPYTSLRKLCAELTCSDATIRKAIVESETLRGWQARSTGLKTAPKATDLGAVVRDNTRQTTEPAPDDVLPDDDVDATMARLIDQARPDERAKLNALDDAGRRALVATYQSQNLDDEPSPLKPDKPGERLRKVKQHKRA